MPTDHAGAFRFDWTDDLVCTLGGEGAPRPGLSGASAGLVGDPHFVERLFGGNTPALVMADVRRAEVGEGGAGVRSATVAITAPRGRLRDPIALVEQGGVFRWVRPISEEAIADDASGDVPFRFVIPFVEPASTAVDDEDGHAVERVLDLLRVDATIAVFDLADGGEATVSAAPRLVRHSIAVGERGEGAGVGAPAAGAVPPRVLLILPDLLSPEIGSGADGEGARLVHRDLADHGHDVVLSLVYDALGTTPSAAAEALGPLLAAALPNGGRLDLLALGSGGLVARWWMEDPALRSATTRSGLTVAGAIFVATPNGGTRSAGRPIDFLDIRTTLAFGIGSAERPGDAAGRSLVDFGRKARRIVRRAAQNEDVAGLWALHPGGSVVERLAGREPSAEETAVYRSVVAIFDPTAAEEGGASPSASVLAAAAAGIFGGATNDLTAPVTSNDAFGRHSDRVLDRIVVRTTRVAPDDLLRHPDVRRQLAQWWGGRMAEGGARVGERVEAVWPTSARAVRLKPRTTHSARRVAATGDGGGVARVPAAATGGDEWVRAEGLLPGGIRVIVSLPKSPEVGHPVGLSLALEGGDPSDPAAGACDLALSVEVEGRGRVLSPATIEGVAWPGWGHRHTWTFQVVCDAVGPCAFTATVLRGREHLWDRRLDVVATGEETTGGPQAPPARSSSAASDGLLTLRIADMRASNGDMELAYTVLGLGLNLEDTVRLDGGRYEGFVDDALRRLETVFADVRSTATLEDRLRALGVHIADTLLPARVRDAIWERRASISAILIVATEQRVPWEVTVIDDPRSREPGFFLAEKGLTRWFRHLAFPVAASRSNVLPMAYVRPDYIHRDHVLPGLRREIAAIEREVGELVRWPSNSRELLAKMRSEADVGVLHFCGHGGIGAGGSPDGYLVLPDGGKWAGPAPLDLLDSRLVAASLRFARERRPLVFLNACRAGRVQRGLVGAPGYASAFLAPRSGQGASVFVGAAWGVDDLAATVFSATFYRVLVGGAPLHVAVARARDEARRRSDDLTWLAYCVYGDPFATFGRGEPTPVS